MYTNPELSSMAKTLVAELKAEGITLQHTKALNIAAKMMGARNLHVYQAQNKGARDEGDQVLFEGPFHDWAVHENAKPLSPAQRRTFEAKVLRHNSQLFIDVSLPHKKPEEIDNTDQLSLMIEVHHGRPRVLVTNKRYGDQVLAVYGLAGGLVLERQASNEHISTGAPSEPSLLEFTEEVRTADPREAMWLAYIESPNRYD